MNAHDHDDQTIDWLAAANFLRLLAEDEAVTFQTYDDDEQRRKAGDARPALTWVLHGRLEGHDAALERLNRSGAGVFVMVNRGDGRGRKAANVTAVRALFVDLDGAALQPVLDAGLEPHAIIETSPGRWHAYWLVSDCSLSDFAPLQRALAARFGGDPSVHDLPRVMRLPGFWHRKGRPFRTRIEALNNIQPYRVADVVAALGLRVERHVDRRTGEILPGTAPQAGPIAPGGRHGHLVKLAGRLNSQGLAPAAIRAAVHAENEARCDPPKTSGEVGALLDDVLRRYVGQHAQHALAAPGVPVGAVVGAAAGNDGEALAVLPPELSDDALALEFAEQALPSFRWTPGMGWMHDDGTRWRRDDALTRYDLARRICRVAALSAKPTDAARLTSAKTVAAALQLAQTDLRLGVPAGAWDNDPLMLNTPNGIVDLRTGSMRPRRPDDYVTAATRVAPDFAAQCSVFERFVFEVFQHDHQMVEFVRRMLGYCLTGSVREQVLFFWYGEGSNGKSTLLDLFHWLMAGYAHKLPANALMAQRHERHPADIAALRGKRVAVSSELDEGSFWNEALVKELTGDETITARFMRQDPFEFRATHRHLIVGNHKPRLRGNDPAMARRLVLVPFEAVFAGQQRDRAMPDKLRAEAPAILAWMIHGAVEWQRVGLAVPERVRAAGADYMAEHDDLALWMAERCVRTGEARASELYSSFAHWKHSCGENAPSMKVWGQRLQAVSGVTRRTSDGVRYAGLSLAPDELRRVRYAA